MHTFDLKFQCGDVEKGQLPGASAHIRLRCNSRDEAGDILVSNECAGPVELQHEVDRLKRELDALLISGRSKFEKYLATTKEAISRKRRTQPEGPIVRTCPHFEAFTAAPQEVYM
jgi:hypothetical protein